MAKSTPTYIKCLTEGARFVESFENSYDYEMVQHYVWERL